MQSISNIMSDSSESSEGCKQCVFLKKENAELKDKLKKNKKKYQQMKQQYEEVLLQKQLLEEQNKLYSVTRTSPTQETTSIQPSIPSSQVSHILEDFDTLLELQGKEINKLMEDRDTLSNLCFKAINLINTQENTINRYHNGAQKLINCMSHPGESFESVTQDLASLGIKISGNVANMEFYQMNDAMQSVQTPVNEQEALSILDNLPNASFNRDSIDKISAFIIQQKRRHEDLIDEIDSQKSRRKSVQQQLNSILHSLNPSRSMTIREASAYIASMKESIINLENKSNITKRIVETFHQFGSRFPNHPDVEKCLLRIQFWLQNATSDEVDVVQEIDFMLGLCINIKNEDNESVQSEVEVYKTMPNNNSYQPYQQSQNDALMLKQVLELKNAVLQMKEQIHQADIERRSFISRNFRKALPYTARWSQICEYILSNH